MKENAPWQDQSGDARALLSATATPVRPGISEIRLAHGVSYGLFLEIAHQGRYAILPQTVDNFSRVLKNDMKRLANLGFK